MSVTGLAGERAAGRIEVRDLVVRYGDAPAVDGVSFTVGRGEHVTLLGPSGCGKTTTLRAIAGLETPSAGSIHINGQTMYSAAERRNVPTEKRAVSMVFQSYAVWPHMSVFDNVAYGLRVRKLPRAEVAAQAERALDLVQMRQYAERSASLLSGGQQQRVALARAIAFSPSVLLFDEPLSNLDAKLRVQMRMEIKKVHQKVTTTTVYVTHDQIEAMTLADRVVVMNGGKIEQIGSPNEVYHMPKTRFVAGFIGSPAMNFLPCRLTETSNGSAGLAVRLSDKLTFSVPESRVARYRPHAGRDLLFGLRPEDIIEKRGDLPSGRAAFDAQLDVVEPMGMETMVYFVVEGTEVCGRVNPAAAGKAGEMMPLVADLNHMHLIDPKTDQVL